MADLTITPASILVSSQADPSYGDGIAAVTITAGQAVYRDTTDGGKLRLARNNTLAAAAAVGISLHAALAGQPLRYLRDGDLEMGAGLLSAGAIYVVSANAGGIAPVRDLAISAYETLLGYAVNSSRLRLLVHPTGVVDAYNFAGP